jgi:hypothetical protein
MSRPFCRTASRWSPAARKLCTRRETQWGAFVPYIYGESGYAKRVATS